MPAATSPNPNLPSVSTTLQISTSISNRSATFFLIQYIFPPLRHSSKRHHAHKVNRFRATPFVLCHQFDCSTEVGNWYRKFVYKLIVYQRQSIQATRWQARSSRRSQEYRKPDSTRSRGLSEWRSGRDRRPGGRHTRRRW